MSPPRLSTLPAVALICVLAGCRADPPPAPDDERRPIEPDETRIVAVEPKPEAPRPRRYELVETAVLGSGTSADRKVEISLPIASTDPGVQEVDSLFVRISPAQPYEFVQDSQGNRRVLVHVKGQESVRCELTYQILRSVGMIDPSKEERRDLTEMERRLLAAEIGAADVFRPSRTGTSFLERASAPLPARGRPYAAEEYVEILRLAGIPARVVVGRELAKPDVATSWLEVYAPGLGWTPPLVGAAPGAHSERIVDRPAGTIVFARNVASAEPRAWLTGDPPTPGVSLGSLAATGLSSIPLVVTYSSRELEAR